MNSVHHAGRWPLTRTAIGALSLGLGLCLWGGLSRADDPDPVSRVARISYLRGEVTVQTNDDDWSTAGINQPLTSGDQLWTDNRGRSELQMGNTTLQVDENTQLRILELSDNVVQVQVTQGVVNVRVRNLDSNDTVEIDTPNAAVTVQDEGNYRIDVADRDDQTIVQVRQGNADVAGEKQSFTLHDDEQLTLRGTSRLSAEFDQVSTEDEFDRWADERNQRSARVASSRYVAPDVIGYEDLDDYGDWRFYNDYGYVWVPTRVVSGWAPYRYGHWSWVSPWGWTWIDDAPWGFAPFHYGRWASVGNRWCWVPGPRTARPVYAPALVAWVGQPGVSVSVNIGTRPVGWIPLGPREVYRPFYRTSRNYIVNVNLSNSALNHDEFERDYRRQPNEIQYRNRNAASVVAANTLREARPVNGHLVTQRAEIGQLQPIHESPVARPDRNVINERRITPPAAANTREVVARRQPAPAVFNRSSNEPRTAIRNEVRVVNPATMGRGGNDLRNDNRRNESGNRPTEDNSGRGVVISPNRYDGGRNNSLRDNSVRQRESENSNEVAPGARNRPGILAPAARPEINNVPRPEVPATQPNRSSPTPEAAPNPSPAAVEPRQRNRFGVRDEARLGGRGQNNTNENAAPVRERQRALAAPSTPNAPSQPAPVQRAEHPPQATPAPAPSTPPVNNSNRAQRNGDGNELRRRNKQEGDAR